MSVTADASVYYDRTHSCNSSSTELVHEAQEDLLQRPPFSQSLNSDHLLLPPPGHDKFWAHPPPRRICSAFWKVHFDPRKRFQLNFTHQPFEWRTYHCRSRMAGYVDRHAKGLHEPVDVLATCESDESRDSDIRAFTDNKSTSCYNKMLLWLRRYSDEIFLVWRVVIGGAIWSAYSEWAFRGYSDLKFLTHWTAWLSYAYITTIILLQTVTYFSLKNAGCLYSQLEDTASHHAKLIRSHYKGCFGSGTVGKALFQVSQFLGSIVVPTNFIVCTVYWYLIYWDEYCEWSEASSIYINCMNPKWYSVLLHGYGGWFIQIDWAFSSSIWLFFNGWGGVLLGLVYIAFLIIYEVTTDTWIYEAIRPMEPTGAIILSCLILIYLPLCFVTMSLVKLRHTRRYLHYNTECRKMTPPSPV